MRLAVFALAAIGCARGAAKDDHLVDVRRDDLVVDVEVTGELAAGDATDVKPPSLQLTSSFKVAWLAPDGSEITEGAPIVAFDAEDLTRSLDAAKVEVEAAQKRLAKRSEEVTLARRGTEVQLLDAEIALATAKLQADVPADLIGKLDRRKQQLDLELAEIDLASTKRSTSYARSSDDADLKDVTDARETARRQIDELDDAIAKLSVSAPRTGTVVYPKNGDDKRKVGDAVYASDAVVQIVGFDSMYAIGTVDEIDIGKVAVGQPVTLRLDALPDLEVKGAIRALTTTVQSRSDADPSKVIQVELSLAPAGPNPGFRPGMRFRGHIETQRNVGVVQIPSDAVFITADGPIAYRATPRGLERVPIALGRRSTTTIEVTSGLLPGDQVSQIDPTTEVP